MYITAKDDYFMRIEGDDGETCTLGIAGKYARILQFLVPFEHRGMGRGRKLLSAAEEAARLLGKKRLVCEMQEDHPLSGFLKNSGYRMAKSSAIIGLDIDSIVNSVGVQKSMEMEFKGIEAAYLESLLEYELWNVKDMLQKVYYCCRRKDLDRFDASFSCVSIDKKHRMRALLLAKEIEDELFVELLMGASANQPQYILAVGQFFVRALMEIPPGKSYSKITMYPVNKSVLALLNRLLDKKYHIEKQAELIRADKKPEGGGMELAVKKRRGASVLSWMDELRDQPYQCAINRKNMWMEIKENG